MLRINKICDQDYYDIITKRNKIHLGVESGVERQDRRRKIQNTYRMQNIQPYGDKLIGAVWLGRVIVARKSVPTALIPPVSPGNT